MAAASLFLDRYDLAAHIATLQRAYAVKKEAMLDAIRRHFPQDIAATDPEGGLFTWLTFPEGFDATDFMRDVALPQARVAYVPGATFFPADAARQSRPAELFGPVAGSHPDRDRRLGQSPARQPLTRRSPCPSHCTPRPLQT